MEIKSVNDLKAMDPELLKKLGIRIVSPDDINKLGLRVFNADDTGKLNTKPFQVDDLTKYGLKNFYTNESVENWLKNNFNKHPDQNKSGSTTDYPDKLANKQNNINETNAKETAAKKETDSKENYNVVMKRRPYPVRRWPFWWGHPASRRVRKTHFSADLKQDAEEEKLHQNSNLTEETPEPAPQQNAEIDPKTDMVDLAEEKNSAENVPVASEKITDDQDESQETVINSESNSGDNSEDNFTDNTGNISEHSSEDTHNADSVKDEKDNERVFQLESIKKGVEIKSNPCKVMPLKVCIPKVKKN